MVALAALDRVNAMRELITSLIASALIAVTVLLTNHWVHMRVGDAVQSLHEHHPSALVGSKPDDMVALAPHERVKAGFEAASAAPQ